MQSNEKEKISEIIKEQIDSFEFRRPCIIKGNELLISNEISYDQAINDEIYQQILDSGCHKSIESLQEFGMNAHYIDITQRGIHIQPINPHDMYASAMPAIIGRLDHDIPILKEVKENHPHGWYRKFEKKRF